jgi:hypothetical protein
MERIDLKENYVNLLKTIDISVKRASVRDKLLVPGMFLRGTDYEKQERKLLIIGRALNGWLENFSFTINGLKGVNVENFVEQRIHEYDKQEQIGEYKRYSSLSDSQSCPNLPGLNWVETYCEDSNGQIKSQRTSNTRFWTFAKNVTCSNGFGNEQTWIKHIAWTNLYKICPMDKDNPKGRLCNCQLEDCKKILAQELELLKPTHILVIAKTRHRGNKIDSPETDSWTKDFYDIFEEYQKSEKYPVYISYVARPEFASGEQFNEMIEQTKKDFQLNN